MTEQQKQILSAFTDNEQMSEEALKALLNSPEQRLSWQRYHLIGALIRGDAKSGMPVDISAAVAEQVRNEPVSFAPGAARQGIFGRIKQSRLVRPAANFAVAASVAVVTVLGVQNYLLIDDNVPGQPSVQAPSALETMPVGGVVNPLSFSAPQPATQVTPGEEMSQRRQLQSFLYGHQQQLQLSQQNLVQDQAEQESTQQELRQQEQEEDGVNN